MTDPLPYQKLERHFHEPARLAILAQLVREPAGVSFSRLHEELGLTHGNLDRHLKVLLEAGIIGAEKVPSTRRPQSILTLTPDGRRDFLAYLDHLEAVLQAARPGAASAPSAPRPATAPLAPFTRPA